MKIVVLGGGISTERDVSLASSRMIYEALKKNGHRVILLDVYLGYEGDCKNIFEAKKDWAADIGGITESNPDIDQIKALRKDGGRSYFGPHVLEICQMADVVFLGLHGEDGENGKVQAAFDLLGIRYTGTDYVSSALSMDKSLAKEIFRQYNIPTPAGIHLKKGEESRMGEVPFPCIVKSCRGGSSVGVCIAGNETDYEKAVEEAFRYDDEAIVEQYIEGREFSCAVIDGKALPVIEIAPLSGFYDYKNKYPAGSTVETCPADLEEGKVREIQEISERVFEALRLKKYARMDFMMAQDKTVYCLEANTLPGMTPTSLIPQEAAAVGVDFGALCEWIIELALEGEEKTP